MCSGGGGAGPDTPTPFDMLWTTPGKQEDNNLPIAIGVWERFGWGGGGAEGLIGGGGGQRG